MPESATEVEVQVVSGAGDGTGGERYVGTGEPIEVAIVRAPACASSPAR